VTLRVEYTVDDFREAVAAVRAQGLMTVSQAQFFYLFLGYTVGATLGNAFQRQPAGAPPRGVIEIAISSLPFVLILTYWAFIAFRTGGKKAFGFVTPPPKLTEAGILVPGLFTVAASTITFLAIVFTPPGLPVPTNQPEIPFGTASAMLILPFVPIVVMLICAVALLLRMMRLNINRSFELQANSHRPAVLEISNDALSISNDVKLTRYSWSGFIGWHETANVILLYTSYLTFEMVPKRAFASPTELEHFRSFITQVIGEHRRGFDPLPIEPSVVSKNVSRSAPPPLPERQTVDRLPPPPLPL